MGLAKTEYYKFEKYEPNPAPEYVTMDQLKALIKEIREEDRDESTSEKRQKRSNQSADA